MRPFYCFKYSCRGNSIYLFAENKSFLLIGFYVVERFNKRHRGMNKAKVLISHWPP